MPKIICPVAFTLVESAGKGDKPASERLVPANEPVQVSDALAETLAARFGAEIVGASAAPESPAPL